MMVAVKWMSDGEDHWSDATFLMQMHSIFYYLIIIIEFSSFFSLYSHLIIY